MVEWKQPSGKPCWNRLWLCWAAQSFVQQMGITYENSRITSLKTHHGVWASLFVLNRKFVVFFSSLSIFQGCKDQFKLYNNFEIFEELSNIDLRLIKVYKNGSNHGSKSEAQIIHYLVIFFSYKALINSNSLLKSILEN